MVDVRNNTVVVVLCGWAGSQARHLKKYENLIRECILSSRGKKHECKVLCVSKSMPVEYIFSPVAWPRTVWVRDVVMKEVQEVVGESEERISVILYAFSNGGGFVVEQVYDLMERYPDMYGSLHIMGILFDSAPGYMTPQVASRVIEEVFPSRGIQRWGAKMGQWCLGVVARFLDGKRGVRYWKMMEDLDSCPICYLYSEDDPLCDAGRLHALIISKLNRGHAVDSVSWAVSGHCRHYAEHPAEYGRAVQRFVSRLLMSSTL